MRGTIELRAIPNQRNDGAIIRKHVRTPAQLNNFALVYGDKHTGYGVYFGVVKRDGKGGKKENCQAAVCLWADIDTVNQGWDTEACLQALHQLDGPLSPSILVESGGGIHAYWLLSEPVEDHEAIEELNKRLAQIVGGDNTHNIDRVMRLPGTWNSKRGVGKAKRVTVTKLQDFWRHSIDEIREAAEAFPRVMVNGVWREPQDVPTPQIPTPETLTNDYMKAALGTGRTDNIDYMWRHRVRYHAPRGYMGINEAALLTTAKLHCKGWKDDEIISATLEYIRDRKELDAPGEPFHEKIERPAIASMLERWKPRWTSLKRIEKETRKRAETKTVAVARRTC